MPQQRLTRPQTPGNFKANRGTDIVKLDKSNLYCDLILNLKYQLQVTLGNNVVANVLKGDEWAVIQKLRLVANSSEVLFEMSGDDLWNLNRDMFGTDPVITPALGGGAADPTVNSVLVIPLWAYRAGKPMDTAFHSGQVNDFRLEITWGSHVDVIASATGFVSSPTLSVYSAEVEPNGTFRPPFVQRIVKQSKTYAAAVNRDRFNIDVGPAYRGFLINVTDGTGADSATLLTNIALKQSGKIIHEFDPAILYQYGVMRNDNGFEQEIDSTNVARQTRRRISAASDVRGWYSLNLCPDGYLTEAMQTGTFNEGYFEITTGGAAVVNVISYQIFPNNRQ